jgi:hypothetical protein
MNRRIVAGWLLLSCCVLAPSVAWGQFGPYDTFLYKLDTSGPEMSVVEECVAEDSCFAYPINGHLEITLNEDEPLMFNLNSNILVPPDVMRPISPEVWDHMDLLEGEYVSDDMEGSVSMVFRPGENSGLRAYELLVEISNRWNTLSITGGIEQDAASPLEPDVRFAVQGEWQPPPDVNSGLPEPSAGWLAILALPWFIASRRRQ